MLRVRRPGDAIALDPEQIRDVIQTDAELSELFMRAFILRRVALIQSDSGEISCWARATRPVRCGCASS